MYKIYEAVVLRVNSSFKIRPYGDPTTRIRRAVFGDIRSLVQLFIPSDHGEIAARFFSATERSFNLIHFR